MVDLESKIGAGGGDQFGGIWVDYRGRGNRQLGICSRPKPAVVSCTEELGEVKVNFTRIVTSGTHLPIWARFHLLQPHRHQFPGIQHDVAPASPFIYAATKQYRLKVRESVDSQTILRQGHCNGISIALSGGGFRNQIGISQPIAANKVRVDRISKVCCTLFGNSNLNWGKPQSWLRFREAHRINT